MSVIAASTSAANFSRRVFRNLIALWVVFIAVIVLMIVGFGTKKAFAIEPLPLPKLMRETAEVEFVRFSQVPSPSMVTDRCQSLLPTVPQDTRSMIASSTRRPAGLTSPQVVQIKAIRAYRQCMSHTALQELTALR